MLLEFTQVHDMNKNVHSLLLTTILLAVSPDWQEQHPELEDTITNSLDMKMVYVPAGKFTMGRSQDIKIENEDEIPPHDVHITKGFYMRQTEVTRGQFSVFVTEAAWETEAERDRWSCAWKNGSFQIVYGIYCEKPYCLTIAEGRMLVETARRYGTIWQCGTQRRSNRSYAVLRAAGTAQAGLGVNGFQTHPTQQPTDPIMADPDALPVQPGRHPFDAVIRGTSILFVH